MQMLAYYTDKGYKLDYLLSLSYLEKIFYFESMEYAIEIENEKLNRMFGSG